MRILQLGKFYPIMGGVEKVMYDITGGLGADGVDCDMLCTVLPGKGVANRAGIIELNDHARIICVPTLMTAASTTISPAMIATLRNARREYDLIDIHHPDPMAALALWMSGFKGRVILHWHSDIVRQKMFLRLYRPLQKWLIRRADRIVGTTPVYLAQSPYLRHVQDKTVAVPIGIDPIRPDADAVTALRKKYVGKKIVFGLGRLVPYKGFQYLVEAAALMPSDYQVVIGGTGPLRESLERRASELGVSDKVTFLGRVPDEELPAWYGACDLFALSSTMKTEAFAIVQIEAMSCGKPVVATKIPESGVSWVNSDGVSGINVPVCDAKALADAVTQILSDSERYKGFCSRALERYETVFTRERMTERVRAVYQTLCR